jgi:PhnB protein
MSTHIRHGFAAARPYIYGHLGLDDLVKYAFDGVVLEQQEMGPESFHIEMQVGDSVVVLETGTPLPKDFNTGSIYVYVPDVDASYRRALERGAMSIAAPEDKPYQERVAGVKDTFGNVWYISTFTGRI